MQISVVEEQGVTRLALAGEIDLHVSPRLRQSLQRLVADKTPALAVDFSGVDYIDSSGLATLIEYIREASGHGGRLVLFGMQPRVKMVFELVRLHELFAIVADFKEAVGRLEADTPR